MRPTEAPIAIEPARHPAALAGEITRVWRRYRWRAYVLATAVGLVVAVVPTVLLTTTIAMVLALLGITVPAGLPWAELAWSLAFAITFAAVGAWAVGRWLPAPFREATESYLWLADRAEGEWRRRTGLATVPRDERSIRQYLDTTERTPETAGERVGMQLALGDVAGARETAVELPDRTPEDRIARLETLWLIDFVSGTTRPLDEIRAVAASVDDPDAWLDAVVGIAVMESRAAVATGRDWMTPMASVRGRLGTGPRELIDRVATRPAFRTLLPLALMGVAIYWAVLVVLRIGAG